MLLFLVKDAQIVLTTVLKLLLIRTMPGIYEMAYTMKRRRGRKLGFIKRVIVERHGLVVLNGPFTGTICVPFVADGALVISWSWQQGQL